MGIFKGSGSGEVDDRVRLVFGGREVLVVESYEVSIRHLQIPSAFSVELGSGTALAAELERKYPPNTPFRLMVGSSVTQFAGRIDGYDGHGGSTQIIFRGRDAMAQLVDDMIQTERSFTNTTYADLARAALEGAGIKGYSLVLDAAAQRKAVTGVPVIDSWVEIPDEQQAGNAAALGLAVGATAGTAFGIAAASAPMPDAIPVMTMVTAHPIEAKAGSTWYAFVSKELDRAGLFLRAGVDPQGQDEQVFLLSQPSARQPPLSGLVNQRGAPRGANAVTVLAAHYKNDTSGRHAEYIVLGRAGSGEQGRQRIEGHFIDDEMKGWGFTKRFVHVDNEAKSNAQAVYLARRKAAEARRKGWTLRYTVRGHTAPVLRSTNLRAVWAPDTVVRVLDDEHAIAGDFWIEGVTFRSSKSHGTTTELTLMRPEDLVFGDGEFDTGPKKGGKGLPVAKAAGKP
jgi:prophage tail gpP-like protein